MVNYAKYVVRDDTDGLTKAIEYSFKQKYYDNPIIKKCLNFHQASMSCHQSLTNFTVIV